MECLTPLVLAALQGDPTHAELLHPPPTFDGHVQRFAEGKAIYGTSLAHHLESENFTVQWNGEDATEEYAAQVLASLEMGWQALIVEGAWPAPVSSDAYLLWVILDPTIGGSGYTTVYTSDAYPEGYPVSWLSPEYGEENWPGFSLSVAVHEFSHMVQFASRDWRSGGEESWYWEASAEWMAEQGVPDIDTYALSTYWYATNTDAAVDSTEDSHQYGMLLLPAYLAEFVGPDVVRDSWSENDGLDWPDAIGNAAGIPFADIVPEMAGAYAAGALSESALFYTPDPYAAAQGEDDESGLLGTLYVQVSLGDEQSFEVTGPVTVRYARDGDWSDRASETCVAALTRTGDGTITWDKVSAGEESGGTDSADSAGETGEGTKAACGCGAGAGGPAAAGFGAGAGAPAAAGFWIACLAVGAARRPEAGGRRPEGRQR